MMSRSHIFLAIILISGLMLRLAAINDPVTYDEAYTYVAFASRSLWGIVSDYSLPNNHIFHSLLVHFSVTLFGNHPWSIRIPALLAGLAIILVAYGFGKSLYSRESGLAAAALTAYFPELIHFSTEARGYSLVGLFTLVIFWLGWHVSQPKVRRTMLNGVISSENKFQLMGFGPKVWCDALPWALLTFCTALGFWTIPTMLFPAGALYLWLFIHGLTDKLTRGRKYFISFFLSGLGVGALTFLLYAPVLKISGWQKLLANGFVQPVNAQEYFDSVLATRLLDTWQTWTKDIPLLLTMILVLGFALALIFHRQISANRASRAPLQLVIFAWIALLVVTRRPDAYDRFWSFLIAPFLLWGAAGLIETAKKMRGRSPIQFDSLLAGLAIIFLVVQSALSIPSIPSRWAKMGNPEAAAIYLKDLLNPGDVVLAGYPNNAPLWYYLGYLHLPESVWQGRVDAPRTYFVLAANQKGQTLETIVKSYKLDLTLFQLERAENIERYGQLIIYRLER